MTPEHWQRMKGLLESALERKPSERSSFLAEACAMDHSLRTEVEALIIAYEQSGGFIESPAVEFLASSLAGETDALLGQSFGHYEIVSRIGVGGMGEVYLAHDARLGRKVALKMLLGSFTRDEDGVRRFQQEARAASALNHPNILTIYEIGHIEARHFIATEFIEGDTLRQRMAQSRLKLDEVLDLAAQVTRALSSAHQAGIAHRDIKPGNIMIRPDGVVKVLDFGLAKLTEEKKNDPDAATLVQTKEGMVMGTAHYMSPEQARGLSIDARSDIFSLGVVLYEMLAGRVPFGGQTITDVLASILMIEPPSLNEYAPETPDELQRIVHTALRKEKDERYQTAAELLSDLQSLKQRLEFEREFERSNSGRAASSTQSSHRPDQSVDLPSSTNGPTSARATSPELSQNVSGTIPIEQEIRFCTTSDGVRIAYATVGQGPPLLKAANWLNHLEFDWRSPIWRHLLEGFAHDHLLVRYDERGNGLSDWDIEDLSFEAMVQDLEAVVDAAGLKRFPILGVSQGGPVAIAYAVRYPEKVSHLILYGSYARGWAKRGSPPEDIERREAQKTLIKLGWGQDNPAFRQLWTMLYVPDATPEQWRWFNDLHRVSTSPENAIRLVDELSKIDVVDLLPQLRVPTLVLHRREEVVVPFEEGRLLAARIPGARFVPLEGRNHLLLESEPAWTTFMSEVRRFLDTKVA